MSAIADAQVKALLDYIAAQQEATCRRLREEAEAEARRILKEAYREGRKRLHQAVEEERARARKELQAVQAKLETAQRRHHQRRLAILLEEGKEALRHRLLEAWHDPEKRTLWVMRMGERAVGLLHGAIQVYHPPSWPEEEHGALAERMQRAVAFSPDKDIEAGIRLCAQGACLDGTVEGLNWEALSMRLLFFLEGG